MIESVKLQVKRKPEIQANGKVKRTGAIYYEVHFWASPFWRYKEFDTRKSAKEFMESLKV